jgi:hypothetical protein
MKLLVSSIALITPRVIICFHIEALGPEIRRMIGKRIFYEGQVKKLHTQLAELKEETGRAQSTFGVAQQKARPLQVVSMQVARYDHIKIIKRGSLLKPLSSYQG